MSGTIKEKHLSDMRAAYMELAEMAVEMRELVSSTSKLLADYAKKPLDRERSARIDYHLSGETPEIPLVAYLRLISAPK